MWQARAELLAAQLEQAQRRLLSPQNGSAARPDGPTAASSASEDRGSHPKKSEALVGVLARVDQVLDPVGDDDAVGVL
jgi:hypothetical protein